MYAPMFKGCYLAIWGCWDGPSQGLGPLGLGLYLMGFPMPCTGYGVTALAPSPSPWGWGMGDLNCLIRNPGYLGLGVPPIPGAGIELPRLRDMGDLNCLIRDMPITAAPAQGLGLLSHPPTSLRGIPGYHMSRGWAIPYNARARNVRACPRARARGMNPRWSIGSLF